MVNDWIDQRMEFCKDQGFDTDDNEERWKLKGEYEAYKKFKWQLRHWTKISTGGVDE